MFLFNLSHFVGKKTNRPSAICRYQQRPIFLLALYPPGILRAQAFLRSRAFSETHIPAQQFRPLRDCNTMQAPLDLCPPRQVDHCSTEDCLFEYIRLFLYIIHTMVKILNTNCTVICTLYSSCIRTKTVGYFVLFQYG